MPDSAHPRETLRVALHESMALVRVLGRGSYRISSALKDFGTAALDKGAGGLVIDLTECIGLDSTFMGVIAGLALRFNKEQREPGRIILIHLSPKLKRLLTTLGLDRLVDIYLTGDVPAPLVALSGRGLKEEGQEPPTEASRDQQMQTMLEAHEDLVKALPENQPQFKDVIEFLRQDLLEKNSKETEPPD